jgi:hypothetical protein
MNDTTSSNQFAYIGYDGSNYIASFNGNVFAGSSFRAPIFYDSDDTNYYLDPNSSSVLYSTNINRAQITNDLTTSSGQGRFGGWYTGTGYTGAAVEVGFSGSRGYVISYSRSAAAYQPLELNGNNIYIIPSSGNIYVGNQIVRQAAGQGWLSGNYASSETAATTGAIYSIGGSYYPTNTALNTMYGVGYTHSDQGQMPAGATSWGFYTASNGTVRIWLGADSGDIIATGNIYAETNRIVATQAWVSAQGYVTGGPYVPTSGNTNVTGWISFTGSTQGTPIVKAVQSDASAGYYLFQGVAGSSEVFRVDRVGDIYMAGNLVATRAWVAAQGYLTSDSDSQTLSWDGPNKNLTISSGNTVTLDGLLTDSDLSGYGFLTSLPAHNHDDRYYTESESDARFQPLENQRLSTSNSPTFVEVYANNWFRNNQANEGLYNEATTMHWSSNENGFWDVSSTNTESAIRFYTGGHTSALRGYVYSNTSNQIGFLTNDGNWGLQVDSSKNVRVYGVALTIGNTTSSDIYMVDSDEGNRRIHCNSGRIGFLNTSNNWGSWAASDGSWYSDQSMRAPIFYDLNDPNYYVDPASTSNIWRLQANDKYHYFGTSSNWDIGSLNGENSIITNVHFQGHPDFWIGAGNTKWYTGVVSGHHDLLINTMQSGGANTRGITFTATSSGASAYRLGRWFAHSNQAGSYLQVDGGVKIGATSDYYSAPTAKLYVAGNTAGADVFAVDGVNGRLFTVSDDLSDSLFSVNTVAGLPIIEAFADNTVTIGKYGSNSITISNSSLAINSDTVDVNFPFYVSDRSTAGGAARYSLTNPGMGFNLADSYAQLQLYGSNGAYIDFVTSAIDSNGRLMWNANKFTFGGNVWGTMFNTSGAAYATESYVTSQGYITSSGRAYPRRQDGTNIDFYYSGQNGQPTWLWGTNNGTDFYVWNPSNFSVSYAASAGSVAWTNVSGRPTAVSSFTNDSNYIASGSTQSPGSWPEATKFQSSGDIGTDTSSQHSLQIYADNGNDAFMAFHISSDYAVFFGLENDTNRLYTGGWSAGANKYQIWDSRDFTSANVSNWNTAYGWGNHASAGYLTALPSHNHDDRYYTESESDSRFVNVSGDTMTGRLTLTFNDTAEPYCQLELRGSTTHSGVYINPVDGAQAHVRFAANGELKWQIRAPFQNGADTDLTIYSWVSAQDAFTFSHGGVLTVADKLVELSSLRYKENIQSLSSTLTDIEKLRPVTYNKIGSQNEEIGLIAEEVAEIYPQVIKYDEAGRPDGINYTRLSAILIKAVQELTEKIKKLEE